MCIIHKGFRGSRSYSSALIVGGNLIGLISAIPYKIIHSTVISSDSIYKDGHLRRDNSAIKNRNKQVERKLKKMDGFGSIGNERSFLRIWFYHETSMIDNKHTGA